MKKIFACTLIALGCMAGTAHAANEVHFLGAVSTTTCDLTPDFGGAMGATVDLGTVNVGTAGSDVSFTLKPTDAAVATCAALTQANTVTVGWAGSEFTPQGLRNLSGNATDAWVKLDHTNNTGGSAAINSSNLLSSVAGDVLLQDGLVYTAQLNGGAVAGQFIGAAKYSVSYR